MEEYSLSKTERSLLRQLYGQMKELPYPLKDVTADNGETLQVYEIPDEDRPKVLAELHPFVPVPALSETMLDIHENKTFKVRDFMVVREGEYNYLVSPYYPKSGGTVLDWVDEAASDDGMDVKQVNTQLIETVKTVMKN